MPQHHSLNYIEFTATDLEAIKKFYSTTFGWKFTDYGPDYVAFSDGAFDGGFERGDERTTAGPLVILYSHDLEASLAAVTQNGGTILRPIFSFPGGRRFHFADPCGNELAIWTE